MTLISACMIVRNEARVLSRCLRSLENAVDEVCIVDTGSDDGSDQLATAWGAKVLSDKTATDEHGRLTDFAYARNCALGMATAEWVLSIDADEVLHINSPEWFRSQVSASTEQAIEVLIRSGRTEWFLPRLFRRQPWIAYRGRVHEWVEIRGGRQRIGSIVVENIPDKRDKESAVERDLRICRMELDDDPNNLRSVLYMARSLRRLNRFEQALPYYERYWKESTYKAGRYLVAYESAMCCLLMTNWSDCRRFAMRAYRLDKRLAESCCMLGDVNLALGRWDLAQGWYRRALTKAPPPIDYSLFIDVTCYGEYPSGQLERMEDLFKASLNL